MLKTIMWLFGGTWPVIRGSVWEASFLLECYGFALIIHHEY